MSLSPSAFALLGLVAWTVLLVLLLVNQRGLLVMSGRMKVNVFAADGSNTPGAFGQRLVRAHANCVENVPLFCAVLLYAMVTQQTVITDPLAPTLLVARIVQSVVHLLSTSALAVWVRFAAFFVQLIILIWWLLRLSTLI
ncbi:MAPEG family protein [Pseudomonas sp. NY15435]|uniref:MAPEG family protein n=1 Tax=Pseudomonas sp. NY15435 TaxID=3400358 RepID=UPI003A2142C7